MTPCNSCLHPVTCRVNGCFVLASPKSTSPNNLQELASELPTRSTQASPWIPIDERLPEINQWCLVWAGRNTAIGWRITTLDNNWRWHVELHSPPPVTHWMPLPDPPEANQEDSVNNTSLGDN